MSSNTLNQWKNFVSTKKSFLLHVVNAATVIIATLEYCNRWYHILLDHASILRKLKSWKNLHYIFKFPFYMTSKVVQVHLEMLKKECWSSADIVLLEFNYHFQNLILKIVFLPPWFCTSANTNSCKQYCQSCLWILVWDLT